MQPDLKVRLAQLQQRAADVEPETAEPETARPEPSTVTPSPLTPTPDKKSNPHALQLDFYTANLERYVTLFLMNGVKLFGKLKRYDQFTLLLESSDGTMQLVFKHALTTIQPGTGMRRPDKAA